MEMRTVRRALTVRPSEKLVLSFLRRRGNLSKAQLARLSSMSAQGVSVIVDRLLDLQLVKKGAKQRGKVGQPSTPLILNPEGAYSIGFFIGRVSSKVALSNFAGTVIDERTLEYTDTSDPELQEKLYQAALSLSATLTHQQMQRFVGIGIAAAEADIDLFNENQLNGGRDSNAQPVLSKRLSDHLNVPCYCVNDIRAACLAELTLGLARGKSNTLYFNIGHWLGSGIILEGKLFGQEDQLSSDLHGLRVPGIQSDRTDIRLIDLASIGYLDEALQRAGHDPSEQLSREYAESRDLYEAWRKDAVAGLSTAIHSACATIRFDRIIVDSKLTDSSLEQFVAELNAKVVEDSLPEARIPAVSFGTFQGDARAFGAAMVPMFKAFDAEDEARSSGAREAVA